VDHRFIAVDCMEQTNGMTLAHQSEIKHSRRCAPSHYQWLQRITHANDHCTNVETGRPPRLIADCY